MAVHSKDSRVLVNERHSSANISRWSVEHSRRLSPCTTILDTGQKYTPGQLAGSMTIAGFFDSAAGSLYQESIASIGTDDSYITTFLPEGFTLGSPAIFCVSDLSGVAVDASIEDVVGLSVTGSADGGVDMGHSLHAHSAETGDGNGTSIDNAASSANGGVGVLHVTAYSGLTNIVVKVQHSADDSAWSDLITFTTATGVTAERKTVSGTVNRYVRALWDVTGTGSATFVVAFARR